MKAIVLHEIGPPENLKFEEIPTPVITAGQVLVSVRACGVCYRDVVDRRGGFPYMKRPVVPGHEFAGEVAQVGEGVKGLREGDRVVNLHRAPCGSCDYCRAGHEPRCTGSIYAFGLTSDGGYAEYVLAPAGCLVPLPKEIPFEKGCFLACTAGVALRGLRTHAELRAGQTVLITGASGGVGLHAVQVAKALGARVVGVTSSETKVDLLKQTGVDEVVISRDLAFHKTVRAVDAALDCVGAPTINASLRSLKPMGRLVVIGNVTISRAEVNPGLLILNELTIVGSSGCNRSDLLEVFDWVKLGKLMPALSEVLPLKAAPTAHTRLEEKSVSGRIVLGTRSPLASY